MKLNFISLSTVLILLTNLCYSQTDFTISVNSQEAYQGNLFFHFNNDFTNKSVKILNPEGIELFSEFLGQGKGRDFKVNHNNMISYFSVPEVEWKIMNEFQEVIDSISCVNGYGADFHDFLALPNGNYILIAHDLQPYALDTIIEGGNPYAEVEGLIIQEFDENPMQILGVITLYF